MLLRKEEEGAMMEIEEKRRKRKRKCQWKESGKKDACTKRRQRGIGLCDIVKFYFDLLVSIYFTHVVALLLMC